MKRKFFLSLFLVVSLSCSGCQMEKNQSATDESGQEVNIVKVEQRQETDYEAVSEALLKMSLDECKKQGGAVVTEKAASDNGECTIKRFDYEDKENELVVVHAVDDVYCTAHAGTYFYQEDNAGHAYCETIRDYGSADPCHPHRLRADYPKEEIAGCSKEEAIEKCKPLAKATGFENSIVNVYAMTVDELNQIYKESGGASSGRPTDQYSIDENPEEYYKHQEEWTAEYEAVYLVYQPVINDVEVNAAAGTQDLKIIYSPKYNRIVYAEWDIPYKDGTVVKKEGIVSQDIAKQTVMTSLGIKDKKNIVFDNIQLVNTATISDTMLSGEHVLVPVWRVDYHLLNSVEYTGNAAYKTTLVDAVTGKMCQLTLED